MAGVCRCSLVSSAISFGCYLRRELDERSDFAVEVLFRRQSPLVAIYGGSLTSGEFAVVVLFPRQSPLVAIFGGSLTSGDPGSRLS